jgi:nicotinamidase-related amidase
MLDKTTTALLIVDVHRAFDEMAAAGHRRNNPDAEKRIADLLGHFRAVRAPIFHARHLNVKPTSRFNPANSGYAVKEEAREADGEPVVIKNVNSCFIGTNLESLLRSQGIHSLVIVGATTNHCVETTVRMAGNLGFDAKLVRDATWTFDRVGPDGDQHRAEDIHQMTLANLSEEFAEIVTADEVRARLAPELQRAAG